MKSSDALLLYIDTESMAPYLGKKKRLKSPKKRKKKKVKSLRKRKPRKPRYYRFRRQPKAPSVRIRIPPTPKTPKPPKKRTNRQRTRRKSPYMQRYCETRFSDGSIAYLGSQVEYTETMTDWTVKPASMSVVKSPPKLMLGNFHPGRIANSLSGLLLWEYYGNFFWISPEATTNCWTPFVHSFKHKKLPTSNDADLMTAFAELDDSIAMLARPSKPSYGSVKWGWMPLISDINAANDAACAVKASYLDGNRRTSRYNATHNITKNSVDVTRNEHVYYHKWDVKVKHIGQVTYQNDILAFYDYMGFHPTPKLFWDLVPLSFAIDYVLPIGDMLKALTPSKGWVKSVNFTGWQVITATVTEICKTYPSWAKGPKECCTRTYVTRNYLQGTALDQITIPKSIEPLKEPSLEKIFDISYLAEAFHKRTKDILSPHVYRKRNRRRG